MKILVDGRGLLEEVKAGVEGYTYNMLKHLQRMYPDNEYILFSYSRGRMPSEELKSEFNWVHYNWSNLLMSFKWRFFSSPKVNQYFDDIDVVWCPNIRFMPVSKEIKKIVTVHDLSFEVLPECYSSRRRMWHWHMNIKQNLQQMDLILAVSQKTAQDIEEIYGIDGRKIKVIYSGVSHFDEGLPDLDAVEIKYDLRPNYILHVSTIEPRKNIYNLLLAYSLWLKHNRKNGVDEENLVDLVLVGGVSDECENIWQYVNDLAISDRVHILGFVDDEDKISLIRRAKALLYNSYYEGFGFPPLEAMQFGVPVAASFAGSLGEVVGRDCLVIDPLDVGGMVGVIDQVANIELEDSRPIFESRGRNLSAQYSWSRAAKDFCCHLEQLMSGDIISV